MAPMSAQPMTGDVAPDEAGVPRHDVPKGGRSGFTIIEERQVHYLEWGHGGLPDVLCLHGGGQTAYMFEEMGAALGHRYHLLAPDLPNHGDSDLMPEGFGPVAIADTMPPLLDDFGMQRVALVGASLGGLTSIRFADAHPDRAAAIALIDVGHRLEPAGVRKIIDFMAAHESFGSLEEAASEISSYLPQRKNVRPESLTRNLRQRDDGRWVWKHGFGRRFRDAPEEEHPANNLDTFLAGVEEAARRVECPVLVLRGDSSDVLSAKGAEEVASIMRNARLETVERAGHLAAGDNPHSTVNLVADFLDTQRW
jgi:pimeloyl-ACP methyl ester carboxylesterase